MAKKTILNARRSTNMTDYITVKLDIYTPDETIYEIQTRLNNFAFERSRDYIPECALDILDMGTDNMMMTFRFSIPFKGNWQDGGKRWKNRTDYLFELKRIMMDLGIKFRLPTQQIAIQDVTKDFEQYLKKH
jgi:hypothetical protein